MPLNVDRCVLPLGPGKPGPKGSNAPKEDMDDWSTGLRVGSINSRKRKERNPVKKNDFNKGGAHRNKTKYHRPSEKALFLGANHGRQKTRQK